MAERRVRFGLGVRLVVLVAISVLITGGLVGAIALDRARQTLRERFLDQSLATADFTAMYISQYGVGALRGLDKFVADPGVVAVATDGRWERLQPVFESTVRARPGLRGVAIVGLDGRSRVSGSGSGPLTAGSSVDPSWYEAALSTGESVLGEALVAEGDPDPALPYAVPVRDRDGATRGAMVALISMPTLSDVLAQIRVGPNARVALLDLRGPTGLILAHSDPSRVMQRLSGQNEAVRRLLAGERGAMETVNSGGERTLAGFTPVSGLPWGVLIQLPADSAYASLAVLTNDLVRLMAGATFLVLVAAVAFALWITRPLRAGDSRAKRVTRAIGNPVLVALAMEALARPQRQK